MVRTNHEISIVDTHQFFVSTKAFKTTEIHMWVWISSQYLTTMWYALNHEIPRFSIVCVLPLGYFRLHCWCILYISIEDPFLICRRSWLSTRLENLMGIFLKYLPVFFLHGAIIFSIGTLRLIIQHFVNIPTRLQKSLGCRYRAWLWFILWPATNTHEPLHRNAEYTIRSMICV